jgi:hypothetical protein
MFSFSRLRGTDDGRSDEDEVPDVKESQENEFGLGSGLMTKGTILLKM